MHYQRILNTQIYGMTNYHIGPPLEQLLRAVNENARILKAGYSDFWSFKVKCIIKYRYVLVIQKKYYKKLFLHIKGYIQFQRFF